VPQGLTSVTGGAGWGDSGGEDIAFTEDMLEAVSDDLCVDKSRVFTMGFSFGGAISYKLACERDELFRAALVYDTGNVSGNNHALCTNPIAFFQSHGHDDGTFSYSSSQTILNLFASSNGCGNTPIPTAGTNEHVCTSLEGCMDGYPVRFCSFGSGQNNPHNTSLRGHYPSAKDPGQEKSWVPVEAWDFIQQF
jgi:poly(3-hydroxybutyrate) depolymerase